jgi:ADP-ribose pyrophosphatase YjhB (NUDIX family)
MVVGCVPEHNDGRILLCLRAIEPRKGYWTIPAGFMENGETVEAAAERETWEEALAQVEMGSLLAVVNVTQARQVHIMFRARLIGNEFGPGDESLETALFDEADIPWQDIAFPSIEFALRRFLSDRAEGKQGVHMTEVPHLRIKR